MTSRPEAPMTRIGGQRVLFVMAATAEYGVELKQRFTPLITGVGPVEAAAVTAASLSSLAAQEKLPDLVVSLGSAGSRTLEQGEIYQVSHVSYRDMDASALGFPKGETPFLDLPATVALPLQIPSIKSARLATGASIVNGAAYDLIESDMVDMETFAVLRAAMQFSVPLVGLRGISDGRQELRRYSDWSEYLQIIDERLAAAVDKLSTAIERNSLSPVR